MGGKEMGRRVYGDFLHISVPQLFRCPISLDVMKSPVSLCTGVTYDRSSIQHWLDSGHDTCPATMQPLPSKDFVPNLTLHRLISIWASSSASSQPHQQLNFLIDRIRRHETQSEILVQSLAMIVETATECEENRRVLAGFDGFVEVVFGVLKREGVEYMNVLELAARVLSLILPENGVKEKLSSLVLKTTQKNWLPSLVCVLQNGNPNSKAASVAILQAISSLNNEFRRLVVDTPNLLPLLLHLLSTGNEADNKTTHDVVLSFLVSASATLSLKTRLIQLGLVGILSDILSSEKAAFPAVEKSLKLLSMCARCAEGRAAISEDPGCAGAVVGRLMKVSENATEHAVSVLWGMCCSFKDRRVREKVARSNGVTKCLLVMQSVGREGTDGGDGRVRRMCVDLVKVLRATGGMVESFDSKTMHILPC